MTRRHITTLHGFLMFWKISGSWANSEKGEIQKDGAVVKLYVNDHVSSTFAPPSLLVIHVSS